MQLPEFDGVASMMGCCFDAWVVARLVATVALFPAYAGAVDPIIHLHVCHRQPCDDGAGTAR